MTGIRPVQAPFPERIGMRLQHPDALAGSHHHAGTCRGTRRPAGVRRSSGRLLPYVTMQEHDNARTELIRSTARLFGAGGLLNGIDPSYMPSYDVAVVSQMNLAFNVIGLAPGLQEIGTLVAAATCSARLFFDEINKFFWWPLHLSGYLLVVVPLPLFVGLYLLRG